MKNDKYFEHLQRYPFVSKYEDRKENLFFDFDEFVEDSGCVDAINHVIFELYDDEMNENGMYKAVNNILSVLYLKKHNAIDIPICYDAYCDIQDLKTGNYDDLFTAAALSSLHKDIQEVEQFISEHPEILK